MPTDALRIEILESTVAALSAQVSELVEQLAKARSGGFRSIRDTRRCPACGSGSVLHVRRVKEVGKMGPANLGLALEQSAWMGVTPPKGPLEVFACRRCGLCEWHVVGVDEIVADGTDIVAFEPEPEPPGGPYR